MAEVAREFIGLPSPVVGRAGAGGHPCQGLYYRPIGGPAGGRAPRTAFIAAHYNVDFSEHYLAPYLAQRGYGFLGWNTRFRGNEAYFLLDHALAEIGVGCRWLREVAGAERVILLGNSGGGSLMAAYQSQAVEPNVTPVAGTRPLPPEVMETLPPGDGFIALAAHAGRPDVLTAWMDPSVNDEADPLSVDVTLDAFHRGNGPPFGPEFHTRYLAAQRARNERITDWVLAQLSALAGPGSRADGATTSRASDRLFAVYRTWADLRMIDPAIEPSERRPNWCYLGEPVRANYGVFGIATQSTLRTWLSMWSLRLSQCRAAPHLARITVPSLVIHASADTGVFDSDARGLYEGLAAADKHLRVVSADHYLQEPAGARDEAADLIAAWAAERN